jgi:hypothetical protein
LLPDKDIKKKQRGYTDEVVSEDNLVMVKWLESNPVCLASNFMDKGVEDKAKRWDKSKSQYKNEFLLRCATTIKLFA